MSNFKLCSKETHTVPKYCSALGESKTKEEWQVWFDIALKESYQGEYRGLPDNWFEKITKLLKLVEL